MNGAALATRTSDGRRRRKAPAGRPGTLTEVETFAPVTCEGNEPGEVWTYSDRDVEQIARNFELLSKGENPLHRVPVVMTHDQVHAWGWVEDAQLGPENKLLTDWSEVAPVLQRGIRTGRFKKVSAEVKKDFVDRDGRVYPGHYLYRVAVLGADVPRVKGLADLPKSFADGKPGRRVVRALHFAEGKPMDRTQAIAFLTQMGIDPAMIPDTVPDNFLIAVAQSWQEAETAENDDGNNPPNPANPPANPPANRGTANPPAPVAVPAPAAPATFADPRQVARIVRREIQRATGPALKAINDAAAAEAAARLHRAAEERQQAVRVFCDRAASDGKISPAENDDRAPTSIRSRLLRMAAQPPVVHTFADPAAPADRTKDTKRTELELQLAEIDARPARRFSERVRQPAAGGGAPPVELEYADRVKARCDDALKRRDASRGTRDASRN